MIRLAVAAVMLAAPITPHPPPHRVQSVESQAAEAVGQITVLVAYLDAVHAAEEWAAVGRLVESERAAVASPARPRASTAAPAPTTSDAGLGGVAARIRACESGGNYAINTGNGYYGAYQFSASTWASAASAAGYGQWAGSTADLAPPEVQDAVFAYWYSHAGAGQWGCK